MLGLLFGHEIIGKQYWFGKVNQFLDSTWFWLTTLLNHINEIGYGNTSPHGAILVQSLVSKTYGFGYSVDSKRSYLFVRKKLMPKLGFFSL